MTQVANSAGAMLFQMVIDEIRQMPATWRNLSETQQQHIIDRARVVVDRALREAVRAIAGADFGGVPIELEGIALKKGAKISAVLADTSALHRLVDHIGRPCVLSFAPDIEQFERGMDAIKADADQPELPLEGELPLEDTDAPRTSSAAAISAREQAMEQLKQEFADEKITDEPQSEPANDEPEATPAESIEDAMARRERLYPNMTREEAERILATAEAVTDETERAMDIVIRRPPRYATDPAVTARNDAALAAKSAQTD